LLDTAVAGTTSITTDADVTLTTTTGASNQARQAIILWNPASGTTTRNITAPAQSKIYTVINASGGTQSIVIRGAGPTTGVTVLKGESAVVAWNGSDFVKVSSIGGAGTFTNLTVTGNLTVNSLTATRVPYASTGGLLVDSANMTFNGTRLTVADLADSGLTAGRVTYAGSGGALVDSANLTFDGSNLSVGAGSIFVPTTSGIFFSASGTFVNGVYGVGVNNVAFNAAGSEQMRLTSSGLTVGTTNATGKLTVAGNVAVGGLGNNGYQWHSNTPTSGNLEWWLSNNQGASNSLQLFYYNGGVFGGATFSADKSGNFGIGMSPVYRLTVSAPDNNGVLISSGNDSHTGFLYFGDASSNTVGAISYDHSSNAMRFQTAGSERARFNSGGYLFVSATASDISASHQITSIASASINSTAVGDQTAALCLTAPIGTQSNTATASNVLVLRGNSGLSSAPGDLIKGYGGNGGSTLNFEVRHDGGMYAAGNVGIGTDSPLQRLDVVSSSTSLSQTIRSTSSGDTNVALRIQDATTGTGNSDGLYLGRSGAVNYLWTYENEPWVFATNNTERARITSGGFFGINTSAPDAMLDVLRAGNTSGGTIMMSGSKTNNAIKYGNLTATHYNNSTYTQGICAIGVLSTADDNFVDIGGNVGEQIASNTVRFWTASNTTTSGGTERARITSGGSLLVGTTTANGARFAVGAVPNDVIGTQAAFIAGTKEKYASVNQLPQGQLFVYDNNSGSGAGTGGAISFGGNAGGGQTTWYAAIEARKDNSTSGDYGAAMVFYTRPNGATAGERMRITSGGAFVVGSTNPVNSAVITAASSLGNMGMSAYNGNNNSTINTVASGTGSGGGLAIISGVSFGSGQSFSRVYAIGIKVAGGGATVFTLISAVGEGSATFTFADSGGFVTVTSTGLPTGTYTVMYIMC
jgi:hypothetical protein